MHYNGKIERAEDRKIRQKNKPYYRLAHWPIWIWVFFLAPGPWTFNVFERGFRWVNWAWLGAVLVGTGIALYRAKMPGCEHRPYILRFNEDKPNPLYRRVCYTFAWNALINFALLNVTGLVIAIVFGVWRLKQIYAYTYSPLCALILLMGILGKLPRVGPSTKGEGIERRYFYGAVWAVTAAQTVLLILWKTLPETRLGSGIKLAAFLIVLCGMGLAAWRGHLPRTRPIVPGGIMID